MKRKFVSCLGIATAGILLISNSVFASNGIVTGNSVRIRESASTSAPEVSVATKGEKVNVIGEENGWYKVEFEDVVGYMSSDYVDTDYNSSSSSTQGNNENTNKPQTPEPTAQENNPEQEAQEPEQEVTNGENTNINITSGTKVTVKSEVSIKGLPNLYSRAVSNIASGTEVTILDELNNWVKVTDGNISGWELKNKITGDVVNTETQKPEENTTTDQDSNVDTENNTENNQQTNTANENSNSSTQNQVSSSVLEEDIGKTGTIIVERAVMRKTPNGEAIDDVLVEGTEVKITGAEDGWYKIDCDDYKGVYIAERLVSIKK